MSILKYIHYITNHIGLHIGIKLGGMILVYLYTIVRLHGYISPTIPTKLYNDDNTWDYYEFVQTWVPAFCLQAGTCTTINNKFIIHGLWPTRLDGTWPSYCTDVPFNKTILSNLTNQLRIDWSDQYTMDYGFWKHEWGKHGTCSLMSEYTYFNNTIGLYNTNNISTILSNGGIIPVQHTLYNITDIYKLFKQNTIYIDCYNYDGNSYLKSIYIHLDKELRPIEVVKKPQSCKNKILYIL